MTKDDFISIAREAGFDHFEYMAGTAPQLARFAELLEAKVRKECAAICRKEAAETDKHLSIVIEALEDCAYLIEKRGEK